ncbi:hypothetical protein ANANG_G00077670 [Anguilla anguilla]|uniref:Uncharacterized protein n=1 Tax=Anguilla anguilla TaxID=7936 RepID=A0A9D3S0F2_ANGAN|nr:hypothetical protein ANANG_G00077670 [Anguilla anguilla]
MNWDSELNSVLSAAESSVAKIRRQLATPGKYPKDMIPEREVSHMTDFKPPPPPRPLPSLALSPAPQWEDLAGIQAQLQSQNQAIESLTKALRSMESERQSQQLHLQALKEELRRLREREEAREQERVGGSASTSPGAERRMENWKREVGRELSSLRGHIDRAVSLTHQEESFSSKMQREEIEQLRREVDQLKQQLRRQEEDMFRQQSETREARRQSERSCKTLESLTDCYRTHSLDLTRTMSQHQSTQEDIRQLRLSVSELKDEVRGLTLRDRRPAPVLTRPKAAASRSEERRGRRLAPIRRGIGAPPPVWGR